MKKLLPPLIIALMLAGLFSLNGVQAAATPAAPSDADAARQLVEKLWAAFAKPDTAGLEKMMLPAFQSLHADGPRTGPEELKLIAALKPSSYVLSNYKVTRSGDVLVVSYTVAVAETIDAARLAKDTMPRMDIFQMSGGEWKWLAHVNVRSLVAAPAAAK